jgi:hypothetical protein
MSRKQVWGRCSAYDDGKQGPGRPEKSTGCVNLCSADFLTGKELTNIAWELDIVLSNAHSIPYSCSLQRVMYAPEHIPSG